MPSIRLELKLDDSANVREIIDTLNRFQRELEWLLNGNLDNENISQGVLEWNGGTVSGNVVFNGTVQRTSFSPFGSVNVNISSATDVYALQGDLNGLILSLKSIGIIN